MHLVNDRFREIVPQVTVALPVEGDVVVSVGEVEARLQGAEGDLAVPVRADVEPRRTAEVEMAALPKIGRDDPPAADDPAPHRHAHGEASGRSFGSRTRL